MWLFTRYGFFSVTNARQGRGAGALDPARLQVRARSEAHLKHLIKRFPQLRGYQIIETPKADYLFRIIVRRKVWATVAGDLAAEIAYPNFKNECVGRPELEDAYIGVLHEVWGAANDLQGRLHGKGAYVWSKEDEAALEIHPEDYYPPGWLEDDFPGELPDEEDLEEDQDQPKETADVT
jgi:hypothetical protein